MLTRRQILFDRPFGLPIMRGVPSLAKPWDDGPFADHLMALDFENGIYRSRQILSQGRTYLNQALQSQNFAASPWLQTNVSIASNAVVAPDGSLTADTITSIAAGPARNSGDISAIVASGRLYTISLYAKAGTNGFLQIVPAGTGFASASRANFDLVNGLTGEFSGQVVSTEMQNVGDGWWRCIVRCISVASGTGTFAVVVVNSLDSSRLVGANAAGMSFHVWQAQCVIGDEPGPPILTTDAPASAGGVAAMPGYSYTRTGDKAETDVDNDSVLFAPNVPGIIPGLGYWSRAAFTNMALRSSATKAKAGLSPANVVDTTAPVGAPSTHPNWLLLDNSTTNAYFYTVCSPMLSPDTVYTLSFLVETPDGSAPVVGATSAGSLDFYVLFGASSIISPTYQYVRIEGTNIWHVIVTATSAAGTLTSASYAGVFRATTNTTRQIKISGFQMVTGTQRGPLITTTGAAATVGADALQFSSPLVDEDQLFWVVLDIKESTSTSDRVFVQLDNGTTNERLMFYITSGEQVRLQVRSGGAIVHVGIVIGLSAAGKHVFMIRRRGGSFTSAAKEPNGTVTMAATGVAAVMPVGVNLLKFMAVDSGVIHKRYHHRRGTFSDADMTAILEAA